MCLNENTPIYNKIEIYGYWKINSIKCALSDAIINYKEKNAIFLAY